MTDCFYTKKRTGHLHVCKLNRSLLFIRPEGSNILWVARRDYLDESCIYCRDVCASSKRRKNSPFDTSNASLVIASLSIIIFHTSSFVLCSFVLYLSPVKLLMEHPFFTGIYYSCELASFQSSLFQQGFGPRILCALFKAGSEGLGFTPTCHRRELGGGGGGRWGYILLAVFKAHHLNALWHDDHLALLSSGSVTVIVQIDYEYGSLYFFLIGVRY